MLVTVDDLRSKYEFSFPETKNEIFAALLQTAEEEVLSYADINQGESVEYFEGGSSSYVLTYCPVCSVTSVKDDGSDVLFTFVKRADQIILDKAAPSGSRVVIKYQSGWEQGKEPETIKQAIAFTVQHLSKLQAGNLLGITTRSTNGGTETIEQSTPPLAVQKMLERFRRNKAL